tara:strand:- start:3220 stop:3924 length:705 start_codon:yes stop_codon:yes gene_type:complete
MQQKLQQNEGLVKKVFNSVFDKYDLMNDIMSFGIHRLWKNELIHILNPSENTKLIDVACGTGDIGKLFLKATNNNSEILCVDPNKKMINEAKKKFQSLNNVKLNTSPAEKLNAPSNFYDYYTISFGIRNTANLDKSISEAYRVLKKGGRFLCLEFSKVENSNLNFLYEEYSKLIPMIGKVVIGDKDPYKYLVKSIKEFVNQKELIEIMKKNKFQKCKYRNLSGGIVAIHSGWKL